jgi:type VI secretion system protein ImpF
MNTRDTALNVKPEMVDESQTPSRGDGGMHPGARVLPSRAAPRPKRGERRYLPTLFDRLCDDAPSETTEAPEAYASSRSEMRQIIQRDLAMLLNTTDQSDLLDATLFPEACKSTINYGVPALAGGYLSEKKWADIEAMIRKAIDTFEPRLIPATLVVRPLFKEHTAAHYNVLTFEISGHIQMQPYPLEFTVQSNVDLETNRIELHYTKNAAP